MVHGVECTCVHRVCVGALQMDFDWYWCCVQCSPVIKGQTIADVFFTNNTIVYGGTRYWNRTHRRHACYHCISKSTIYTDDGHLPVMSMSGGICPGGKCPALVGNLIVFFLKGFCFFFPFMRSLMPIKKQNDDCCAFIYSCSLVLFDGCDCDGSLCNL